LRGFELNISHSAYFQEETIFELGVLSIMSTIPEISVRNQMEKSISVSSDQNIRDHLWWWSTFFGWNIPTEIRRSIFGQTVSLP